MIKGSYVNIILAYKIRLYICYTKVFLIYRGYILNEHDFYLIILKYSIKNVGE